MTRVQCQEVVVKFRNNQNSQRISATDGGTFVNTIQVDETPNLLRLLFVDKAYRVRKVVAFPMDCILEYDLSSVDTPVEEPTIIPKFAPPGRGT